MKAFALALKFNLEGGRRAGLFDSPDTGWGGVGVNGRGLKGFWIFFGGGRSGVGVIGGSGVGALVGSFVGSGVGIVASGVGGFGGSVVGIVASGVGKFCSELAGRPWVLVKVVEPGRERTRPSSGRTKL